MTTLQAILSIVSGLVLIVGLIMKLYYKKKEREPYNFRLSVMFEAYKKWREKRNAKLNKDNIEFSVMHDELNDGIDKLRKDDSGN